MATDGDLLSLSDRDVHLTFGWTGIEDRHLVALGLPITRNIKRSAALRAIVGALDAERSTSRWIAYSRDRNYYVHYKRYGGLACSYAAVIATIKMLLERGLIEEERARPNDIGWRSRMRSTASLHEALGNVPRLRFDPIELVRLKDAKKRHVPYDDTPKTRHMRSELRELNEAFAATSIDLSLAGVDWNSPTVVLDGQILHPTAVAGYRVFNGSWKAGGRLYGCFWQNLPKELRPRLTINGSAVVEEDFPQIHPQLLYAIHRQHLQGDAYAVSGFEHCRQQLKPAWQIMINAASRKAAVFALARRLGGLEHRGLAATYLQALEKRHACIRGSFYSGVGLRLQYLDSELMIRVERACLHRGIVALPVHDSFIVQQRYGEHLRECMERELSTLLSSLEKQNLRIV